MLFTGDQAGCVQTQKSECKGAEGHNPPRTESLGGTHKWVILFKNDPLFLKPFFLIVYDEYILITIAIFQRIAGGNKNPWDYRSWSEHHSHHGKWLQYPEIRSSGPVCGLDPA